MLVRVIQAKGIIPASDGSPRMDDVTKHVVVFDDPEAVMEATGHLFSEMQVEELNVRTLNLNTAKTAKLAWQLAMNEGGIFEGEVFP